MRKKKLWAYMYNRRATWDPCLFCFSLQLFDVTAAHSLPLGTADPPVI